MIHRLVWVAPETTFKQGLEARAGASPIGTYKSRLLDSRQRQ